MSVTVRKDHLRKLLKLTKATFSLEVLLSRTHKSFVEEFISDLLLFVVMIVISTYIIALIIIRSVFRTL